MLGPDTDTSQCTGETMDEINGLCRAVRLGMLEVQHLVPHGPRAVHRPEDALPNAKYGQYEWLSSRGTCWPSVPYRR